MDSEEAPGATPRPISVLIAQPSHGLVHAGFAYSLARAMTKFAVAPYDGKKQVDLTIIKGSNLTEMRTKLVSRAMSMNATHILWLDSDMKFPPDTIARLLNHNEPIVGCNYPQKEITARPTAYCDCDDYVGPLFTTAESHGLQEVAHVGMGVLLTEVGVFERLDLPFFHFEPQAPDFVATCGEDVYFCRKARAAGFKIYVDHDLSREIGHIGEHEYTNYQSELAEFTRQEHHRASAA